MRVHFTRQIALCTLPERKQRVQTRIVFGEPLTIALVRLILGFQTRLLLILEWLILLPDCWFLLQISHRTDTLITPPTLLNQAFCVVFFLKGPNTIYSVGCVRLPIYCPGTEKINDNAKSPNPY